MKPSTLARDLIDVVALWRMPAGMEVRMRESPSGRLVDACNLFDEVDDATPQSRALYSGECLGECQSLGSRQEIQDVSRRGGILRAMGPRLDIRGILKKERHRHLEDLGNLLEPACSDPVRALLIFLNLLERETEGLAELFLTHGQHHAPHPDPAPHVPVDRVRGLLCHIELLCGRGLPWKYNAYHCGH